MYSHGVGLDMLDRHPAGIGEADKEMPEGFTAFKSDIDPVLGVPVARFASTLTAASYAPWRALTTMPRGAGRRDRHRGALP